MKAYHCGSSTSKYIVLYYKPWHHSKEIFCAWKRWHKPICVYKAQAHSLVTTSTSRQVKDASVIAANVKS